jgi:hypothetical protein
MIKILISLLSFLVLHTWVYAESDTVKIEAVKDGQKKGQYSLRVSVPKGFGIQIDAPNKLLLSAGKGLVIKKADLSFTGMPNPKKPEYFLVVKKMPLTLEGSGSLEVSGKVYYCDYSANVCMFEKVQKRLDIP